MICQARKDTDRDGKVGVRHGMHGEIYGDELAPYWVRTGAAEEELGDFVGIDPQRRYLVALQGKVMRLIDTRSNTREPLPGADARYIEGGLFGGRRVAFDAGGEHLLYLRVAAGKKGKRTIVVRTLADGTEHEIDPGPGQLRQITIDGAWVMATVWDPAPGTLATINRHSSGPLHTVGGRRCRADWTHGGRLDLSGTQRRWAPLGGGPARTRKDVLAAVGADLIVRRADGALALEQAGGTAELAPAACHGVVLDRAHQQGSVLYACVNGLDSAPVHLWRGGSSHALGLAAAVGDNGADVLTDLERRELELRDRDGGRLSGVQTADGWVGIDMEGRHAPATSVSGTIIHEGHVLQSDGDKLAVVDLTTGARAVLPVEERGFADLHQRGRLIALGWSAEGDAGMGGVLIDLHAGALLGRFTGPVHALSDGGWILTGTEAAPGKRGVTYTAPLHWVRPTAP